MPRDPEALLSLSPVIPVVTLERAEDAAPLALALLAGGVCTMEITLRTAASLDAIRAAVRAAPDFAVGAGTVLSATDLAAAADAGAAYAFSPGATLELLQAGRGSPIPLIPGVGTASEVMRGLELGYRCFKFFPAEPLGGPEALSAFAAPLPAAKFCPTGGIAPDSVKRYLALRNVLCVGGSWVAPQKLIEAGDWSSIEALARKAAALGS